MDGALSSALANGLPHECGHGALDGRGRRRVRGRVALDGTQRVQEMSLRPPPCGRSCPCVRPRPRKRGCRLRNGSSSARCVPCVGNGSEARTATLDARRGSQRGRGTESGCCPGRAMNGPCVSPDGVGQDGRQGGSGKRSLPKPARAKTKTPSGQLPEAEAVAGARAATPLGCQDAMSLRLPSRSLRLSRNGCAWGSRGIVAIASDSEWCLGSVRAAWSRGISDNSSETFHILYSPPAPNAPARYWPSVERARLLTESVKLVNWIFS